MSHRLAGSLNTSKDGSDVKLKTLTELFQNSSVDLLLFSPVKLTKGICNAFK